MPSHSKALAKSFGDLVELQHDLGEDVRFTRASVRSFGVADGTDVEVVEILVDDTVVKSCDFLGLDDRVLRLARRLVGAHAPAYARRLRAGGGAAGCAAPPGADVVGMPP